MKIISITKNKKCHKFLVFLLEFYYDHLRDIEKEVGVEFITSLQLTVE